MELVKVSVKGTGISAQQYSPIDNSLITSNFINSSFGAKEDYIEIFIYDQNGNILLSDYDGFDYYPYLTSNPQNNLYNVISLDPQKDVINRGFTRGSVNIQYSFFKKLFNSQFGKTYWIKEISESRTELKLASQVISDIGIIEGFDVYQNYISTKNYYSDFYLNFGDNNLVIGVNVAVAEDEEGTFLLVKLYEPLDADIDVKAQLWIVDKISEAINYNVDIQVPAVDENEANRLRGPNFAVRVSEKIGQTTPYYSYNSLIASNYTSSFQKLLSYYQDKSVEINVDYSNFGNFIHFSSAVERLENFKYKLELIESYNNDIRLANSYSSQSPTAASSSIGLASNSINNVIKNFDTYEYFLYFDSGSWSWPKRNNTQPFALYSVTSSQASNWLGSIDTVTTPTTASLLYSASLYDYSNKDYLRYSIPQYLLDDSSNQPYLTFLDMIGQHFDNIWIYYKDVTNRFDATNNPNTGISLDLVSDALRGLGFELYTNTSITNNLYYTLFGINQDGTLLPPTGSERITNYVTSSIATLPGLQIQDEYYKRLYHNLPYLLKTRGTQRGIKALIASYGIPDTILDVKEFGGVSRETLAGIYDIDSEDYKITIATGSNGQVTGSSSISSSLLSYSTTLQYYSTDKRLNSANVEVGFSPSNTVNNNITASGVIIGNIDQYIGNPSYANLSTYPALDTLKTTYFQSYDKPKSVWEYIRLIKFYNNSLFKTIKDFVPARANLSTGIIIKSHILERNKYARNEPSASVNQYSESIELLSITGSAANTISGSTNWQAPLLTLVGYVPYSSSQNIEKFTGEFSGSIITATDYESFPQIEYNNNVSSSNASLSNLTSSLLALYQNVTASVRSQKYFDLDYTSNQSTPVNFGIVTQSISQSQVSGFDNQGAYTSSTVPYAELQDSNYALQSFTIPRYYGSKTISATYTDYTVGDASYGDTAAIDKIKFQYAYLVDIYSSSLQLPERSNAQIKYIIDNEENVLNLTKLNNNIFTSQNLYKSGESVDISLFDYDPNNPDGQFLTNNSNVTLYEGGFRYSPILYNPNGAASLTYNFATPIVTTGSISTPGGDTYTAPLDQYNYFNWTSAVDYSYSTQYSQIICTITASVSPSPLTQTIRLTYLFEPNSRGISNGFLEQERYLTVSNGATVSPLGSSAARAFFAGFSPVYYFDPVLVGAEAVVAGSGGSTSFNVYSTSSIDISPSWTYNTSSAGANVVRLSATQSLYYLSPQFVQSGSYPGIEQAVFPFQLNVNDLIRLYNYTSSLLDRNDEYRVVNTFVEASGSNNFPYVNVTLDRPISPANYTSSYAIYKYIVLKHIPDETNLILELNGAYNIPTDGLIFPKYISKIARENSGNVIKSLKQQNLI